MAVEMNRRATHEDHPATLLRRVLLGNALFSALTGAVCVAAAPALSRMMGVTQPAVWVGLGMALLFFAALVAWAALRVPDIRPYGRLIFWADVVWVAASVLLLITGLAPLTPAGVWVVVIVADLVAVFAVLEYIGLRRLKAAAG